MSAHWSGVARSDLGRALQEIGKTLLYWLKLVQGVVTLSMGAVVGFCAGCALLEPDRTLPRLARQFAGGYLAALRELIPSDVPTLRNLALALLLAGLVMVAGGFVELCNWFLDRRE
jgi:uncharacterized membrane protein HdeD (DUF308 family)